MQHPFEIKKMNTELIKKLRQETLAPMNEVKLALEESNYDFQKATEILKIKGLETTARNASKVAAEGKIGIVIDSGLHSGTMLELSAETDFTAETSQFKDFLNKATDKLSQSDDFI